MNILKFTIIIFSAALCVCGCTSVHVHHKDGSINTTRGFGIINVSMSEKNSGYIIDAKGVGLVKIGSNLTLGYTKQKIAALDNSCRVIFWLEDVAQTEKVVGLLKNIGDSCIVNDIMTNTAGENK